MVENAYIFANYEENNIRVCGKRSNDGVWRYATPEQALEFIEQIKKNINSNKKMKCVIYEEA